MSSLHSIPHGVCSVPEPLGRVSASGGHLGISRPERLWLLSLGEREADWASVLPGMGGWGTVRGSIEVLFQRVQGSSWVRG